MIPPRFGVLAGSNQPAQFIGSQTYATSGVTLPLTLPAGTQAGDYCFIFCDFATSATNVTGGSGGWTADRYTWVTFGYASCVLRKTLTSMDVSGPISLFNNANGGTAFIVVYRGVSGANLQGVEDTITLPVILQGFTKALNCVGLLTNLADRDAASSGTMTPPTFFTGRDVVTGTFMRTMAADLLSPGLYGNNSNLQWGLGSLATEAVSHLYELLG